MNTSRCLYVWQSADLSKSTDVTTDKTIPDAELQKFPIPIHPITNTVFTFPPPFSDALAIVACYHDTFDGLYISLKQFQMQKRDTRFCCVYCLLLSFMRRFMRRGQVLCFV